MLFLSFCCCTGMTAHGRENKRAGSPFLQLAAQQAEQFFVIWYAPAAGCDANTLAFYSRSQFARMGRELLLQFAYGIGQVIIGEGLTDADHMGNRDAISE